MSLEWALRNAPRKGADQNKHHRSEPSAAHALRSMGRTVLGILVACVFVCLSGGFLDADPYIRPETPVNQASILVALVFAMALTAVAVVGPRRISISFFYRWMCPALVLGFASVILARPLRQHSGFHYVHFRAIRFLPHHADVFRTIRRERKSNRNPIVRMGMDRGSSWRLHRRVSASHASKLPNRQFGRF